MRYRKQFIEILRRQYPVEVTDDDLVKIWRARLDVVRENTMSGIYTCFMELLKAEGDVEKAIEACRAQSILVLKKEA